MAADPEFVWATLQRLRVASLERLRRETGATDQEIRATLADRPGVSWVGEQIVCLNMERRVLDYRVEVVEPLDVWLYLGGWGDGPYVQHAGARLFLTYAEDGQVFFDSGWSRPPSSIHTGGVFPEMDLPKVRRMDDEPPTSDAQIRPVDSEDQSS